MDIDSQGIENQTQVESPAPETAPVQESATPEMQAILDLSKAEKFKFDGKEYTAKDLQNWRKSGLRQDDYTKKTQELAQQRSTLEKTLQSEYESKYEPYKKYSGQNLYADLMKVKQNPALASEFVKIYPKEYHGALEMMGIEVGNRQQSAIDPETQSKIDQFLQLGSRLEQRELQTMTAEIDAHFSTLTKKYPLVDDEMATVRLESLANRKGTLTSDDYDSVFKELNSKTEQKFKAQYSALVSEQKNKNNQGKDVPAGGGLPGQAPKQIKTFEEAQALFLQALNQS